MNGNSECVQNHTAEVLCIGTRIKNDFYDVKKDRLWRL
ncbi:MAG: hypothetical protein JWP12_3861 [Bacteroidetes bacterium]|nr:hypothetical protein [Bacteroidota bacterium]